VSERRTVSWRRIQNEHSKTPVVFSHALSSTSFWII
jgi:hypothetical protein